jgi:hypothetical protein
MSRKKYDGYSYPIEAENNEPEVSEASSEEHKTPIRSPDDALLSDIIHSILEIGRPQYSSELFVNETFGWYEAKKKVRTLGNSKLEFPQGVYVGRFNEVHQFYNKTSILNFIKETTHDHAPCELPFYVRTKVQERFPSCAIGVAGGHEKGEPISTINVIWIDEKTRIYYDPYKNKQVCFAPKVIVI